MAWAWTCLHSVFTLFSWHFFGNLHKKRLALVQYSKQILQATHLLQAHFSPIQIPSNNCLSEVSINHLELVLLKLYKKSKLSFIMKRLNMKTVAMTTVVLLAVAVAMASPAQATCSSDLSPYKVCMPAVLGDTPSLPTTDCCKIIKVADIACLCTTVTHASLPSLNVEAALMLPKRCGVIAPGTSTCATAGNPLGRKLMHF